MSVQTTFVGGVNPFLAADSKPLDEPNPQVKRKKLPPLSRPPKPQNQPPQRGELMDVAYAFLAEYGPCGANLVASRLELRASQYAKKALNRLMKRGLVLQTGYLYSVNPNPTAPVSSHIAGESSRSKIEAVMRSTGHPMTSAEIAAGIGMSQRQTVTHLGTMHSRGMVAPTLKLCSPGNRWYLIEKKEQQSE